MAEIKTIIRADSTQHDNTVKKSANEIYRYQKKVDDTKKTMNKLGSTIKSSASSFLKGFIPAVGGAVTVMEGFKKLINSTEQGTDKFQSAIYTAKTGVDMFFQSVATGNLNGFINDLKDITKNAKEAYAALDELGTAETWTNARIAILESKIAEQKVIIRNPNATEADKKIAEQLVKDYTSQIEGLMNLVVDKVEKASTSVLRNIAGASATVSDAELQSYLKLWEQGELDNFREMYKEHNSTLETVKTWTTDIKTGQAYAIEQTVRVWKGDTEAYYNAMERIATTNENNMKEYYSLLEKEASLQSNLANRQYQTNRLTNGGSGGSGGLGSNKGSYQEGSISWYDAQIKALHDLITTQKLSAEELKNIQTQIIELEQQKLEYVQSLRGGKLELIPELTPKSLSKISENVQLEPTALKEFKQDLIDINELGDALGDTFNSVGSIFGSFGDIAGESGGQVFKMFGDMTNHIANIIPKILSLTAAEQGEALAAGTSSAAKLPFPANLAAIASIVAEIIAVFASISKFAEGGIVGGKYSIGDYNLARVNSGEMILNGKQQAHLFNMLNGIGSPSNDGVNGNVVFRISGNDLVGTLDNYNRRMGRVR